MSCDLYLPVVHFCINCPIWATGREFCQFYAARWRPYHTHVRSRLAAAIIDSYFSVSLLKPVVKFTAPKFQLPTCSRWVLGARKAAANTNRAFFFINYRFIFLLMMRHFDNLSRCLCLGLVECCDIA
jgi:hypothetical protein